MTKSQSECIWNEPSFTMKPKSISSFVGGFKSAVISEIDDYIDNNKMNIDKFNRYSPLWQTNFHDQIIRDYDSYLRIARYICGNLWNWKEDHINPNN